jgi:O-antigen ligase
MTRESAKSFFGSLADLPRIGLVSAFVIGLWGLLLFVAPSPVYALGCILAMVVGLAIVVYPRVGVYLVVFLLIVQMPFEAFRYLGILVTGSSLIYLLLHGKRLLPYNPVLALCGAFVCATLASAVQPQTSVGLLSHVLAIVSNCSLVWLMSVMVDGRAMILNCVRLMIAAGVVVGIVGLVQWRTHFVWIASTTAMALSEAAFRGKTGLELQQWHGEFRVDSIVGTPDYLPLYMQTLAPFVALIMVRQKRWSARFAMLAILILFAVTHLLSYTRGAMLTTAIVVACTGLVIDHRRFITYAPFVSAVLLTALLSWSPWRHRLETMVDFKSDESVGMVNTGAWRLNSIPIGIGIIQDYPVFGVGIGQGKWNWPKSTFGTHIVDPEDFEPPPFHNDYLGIGVETGCVGLLVFVALLGRTAFCLFHLARTFRDRQDNELSDVAVGLLIALIGLMAAMTLYPLATNFRYLWLILGLCGALIHYEQHSRNSMPSSDKAEAAT